MPDTKISNLTELTAPDANDELVIVDKSDTSMAASGTTKKVLVSNIKPSEITAASASGPTKFDFFEDTDNGTNKVTLQAPAAVTSDSTVTLPDSTGVVVTDGSIHAATEKTTPADADELGLIDSAASYVLKRLTWANVKATLLTWLRLSTTIVPVNAPQGFLINGKISVTDTGSGLTVAIKTLAGTDPSATDPVYCRIGDAVRSITAALSKTVADGVNTFNAGSAELATKEIDYPVFLSYNATDGVVIGFSRYFGSIFSDFSTTATNEKYLAYSGSNAAASDPFEVIGRFAATLSAGAGYTWSVPTFTAANLIQRPIYETRWLDWTPAFTGFSAAPATNINKYKVTPGKVYIDHFESANGTSNADAFTITLPFTAQTITNMVWRFACYAVDNGATSNTTGEITLASAASTFSIFKNRAHTAWTTSGGKRIEGIQCFYEI